MKNIEIRVGQSTENLTVNTLCSKLVGVVPTGGYLFECVQDVIGCYVSIQIMEYGVLTICEAQVFATGQSLSPIQSVSKEMHI